MSNQSEVTRILSQIQTEYQSATLGLSGLSQGTCQHKIITAKMEHIADLHIKLRGIVGDEAMQLIVNTLDQAAPASTIPSS